MRISEFRGKFYVKVQNLNFNNKPWKCKTFKTMNEALDFGGSYMGGAFVHQIDPEIYNYALQIKHPIFQKKNFCFA